MRSKAGERGFTLVEILVALAISAVLVMAVTSIGTLSLKQQTQSNVTFHADTFRHLLMSTINNSQAWTNTIAANAATLGCLKNGGKCTNGATGPITYIRDGFDKPFYDWNGSDGLTAQASPCRAFSATPGSGQDGCPLQFQVNWKAVCNGGGANCDWNQTQSLITLSAAYNPASQSKRIAFNPANYSAEFMQGSDQVQCSFSMVGNNLVENCADNVGIGTTSPQAKFQVSGQIVSGSYNNGAALAFDMNKGNAQYTAASCGTVSLKNMGDGGSYTIVIQGTTSAQCSFVDGTGGRSFRYSPPNGPTTAGTQTVYSMQVVGSTVYVSWISGF